MARGRRDSAGERCDRHGPFRRRAHGVVYGDRRVDKADGPAGRGGGKHNRPGDRRLHRCHGNGFGDGNTASGRFGVRGGAMEPRRGNLEQQRVHTCTGHGRRARPSVQTGRRLDQARLAKHLAERRPGAVPERLLHHAVDRHLHGGVRLQRPGHALHGQRFFGVNDTAALQQPARAGDSQG